MTAGGDHATICMQQVHLCERKRSSHLQQVTLDHHCLSEFGRGQKINL